MMYKRATWALLAGLLALTVLLLAAGCQARTAGGSTPALPTPTAGPTATPAILGCSPATSPPLPAESRGDPYYPQLGIAGYDVEHYALDLSADPAANTLSGTATIRLRAVQDLGALSLDLHGLTVQSVTVAGAAATFQHSGDKLHLDLPQPARAGQVLTAVVAYGGTPVSVPPLGTWMALGWLSDASGTYVSAEPNGAQGWFPANDHPCDKATYTIRVTVPKPNVAAANGELVDTQDNGASTTFTWEMRQPMASYLAAVCVGDLVPQTTAGPDGLPIRSYYTRAVAGSAPSFFSRLGDVIAFFEEHFGPYPFSVFGVAVADMALDDWAMENQTLCLFGRDVDAAVAQTLGPHELAHQWFGDSVSLKSWQDIWLNEGFATYAEALWYENEQGTAALEARLRGTYPGAGSMALLPPGSPPPGDLFNRSVYLRGALTLHALRREVGDDTFFKILRTWADRYRHGNAGTGDFLALANEVSGRDVAPLLRSWLFDAAIPPYPQAQINELFRPWRLPEKWRPRRLDVLPWIGW
jgi:aminopeptidase N